MNLAQLAKVKYYFSFTILALTAALICIQQLLLNQQISVMTPFFFGAMTARQHIVCKQYPLFHRTSPIRQIREANLFAFSLDT